MLTPFHKLIIEYTLQVRGIIHVGAHYGEEYPQYLACRVPDVVLIEPCIDAFQILRKNVGLYDGATCINAACGAERGKHTMFTETANKGQSNSLLKPAVHATQYPDIVFNGSEEVSVIPLDEIMLNSRLGDDYNMLVMDVQGYEHKVLAGASKVLRNIDYVYTEVNRAELYEGCARVEGIDAMLSDFERVNTNWAGGTWGDALYIRKPQKPLSL